MKLTNWILLFLTLYFKSSLIAQSVEWNWARAASGMGNIRINAITTDPEGNIYTACSFSGDSMLIDGNTVINKYYSYMAGNGMCFLAKWTAAGKVIWIKKVEGQQGAWISAIACDRAGDLLMVGDFYGKVRLDSFELSAPQTNNLFVVKLSGNGSILWGDMINSRDNIRAASLAVDNNNDFCLLGYFEGDTLRIGPFDLINTPGQGYSGNDAFLVKWHGNGSIEWAKSGGGNENDWPQSICADNNGNFYFTGFYTSNFASYDSVQLHHAPGGDYHFYLIKVDQQGNFIWGKTDDGVNNIFGTDVVCDNNGNLYVCGSMTSTFHMGLQTLLYNGTDCNGPGYPCPHSFIIKIDPVGKTAWAKVANGNKLDQAAAIAVDEPGNIYMTGTFVSSSISFGNSYAENSNPWSGADVFIAGFTNQGQDMWIKAIGGSEDEIAMDIACSGEKIYVAGNFFSHNIHLDTIELFNDWPDKENMFLAQLNNVTTTGIETNKPGNFLIYPNPSTGKFMLGFHSIVNGTIKITNVLGDCVLLQEIHTEQMQFDLSRYPKGMYFAEIICGGKKTVSKLVKE